MPWYCPFAVADVLALGLVGLVLTVDLARDYRRLRQQFLERIVGMSKSGPNILQNQVILVLSIVHTDVSTPDRTHFMERRLTNHVLRSYD